MNELLAHMRPYPHFHPHAAVSESADLVVTIIFWCVVLTALWWGSRLFLRTLKDRPRPVD